MDGEMIANLGLIWPHQMSENRDYTPTSPKAEYLYWSNRRERDDD